jgi:hypothetical protein
MGIYVDRGYSLQECKDAINSEIDAWYSGAALDTFVCNVIGQPHRYECGVEAQVKLMSGKVSNQPVLLTCGIEPTDPSQAINWELKPHSATECGKVHTAYMAFSASIDALRNQYKQQAAAASTIAAIEVLFYTLYPTTA